MTTRSLTESFLFMRNNAFQNRQFFADSRPDDHEALVQRSKDKDTESGRPVNRFPPEWQRLVNSVQYTFTVIRQKMKELIALHDRHLMATNLDDNVDEDQEIEQQTKELTEIFSLSHRQLGQLSKLRHSSSLWKGNQVQKCSENVLSSLARTLQDLSTAFRRAQSSYLNKLKSRDERIKGYLSMGPQLDDGLSGTADEFGDNEYQLWEAQRQRRGMLLEENTNMVVQREQEINQIVRSIHELNEIFRDVAQLVVDQGTIVDRIDYNVEHTQMRVESGLKQLTEARKHQSKDRKMLVILVLAALVVVFGLLLIVTKFT
ncbi:Syntaxin-16 [Fasciola hepatica]|uniref:Syntaxin-16 n=1 Tax=Fasciola hepatica TaxID=6192 RepID=A0A4E0RIM8_FASHE|nr:Syntaxin-16 [Fasciola hepatica]